MEAQERMETIPTRQQVGDGLLTTDQLQSTVEEVLAKTPFIDVHTHLFAPSFGGLGLWGIDELLTYHYLEAELFRSSRISPEHYWSLPKREQASAIWQALFVENSPASEVTRASLQSSMPSTCRPIARISKRPARSSAPNGWNRTWQE